MRNSMPTTLISPRRFRSVLAVVCCLTFVSAGLTGCGTNIDALVAQSGNAMGTTLLDIFLTDLTNAVVDSVDRQRQADDGPDDDGQADDGDQDQDDNGDDGDGADDGDGQGLPEGDAAAGEVAYTDAGCGMCHGDQGATGIPLAGEDQADALLERFEGGANHQGTTLTEQEIADVAAWLLGL